MSPWWIRAVVIVMIAGFAGLILITCLSYRNAPPIPSRVVSLQGAVLFTADDVGDGQAVFLRYGLMANGSIWGHGAYLGPDNSAAALHRMGLVTAEAIAQAQHQKAFAALDHSEAAAVQAETAVALKTNRYDESSGTLQFTDAQVMAFTEEIRHWTAYFHDPSRNGVLKVDLITDPIELRQFTAFVTWAAWASVAARPGEAHSYTNNFPYDPSVGNIPISGALLWSALQPDGVARRYFHRAAGLREIRLPGLDHARPQRQTADVAGGGPTEGNRHS